MQSYTCFVHTQSSMTPQMRLIAAGDDGELIKKVSALVRQWPAFELVDLYDETDRLVLRMTPHTAPRIS